MAFMNEFVNTTYLFCVLQYRDDKVWVKIEEPCNYEHFIEKGYF